jgi:hypothetical protein
MAQRGAIKGSTTESTLAKGIAERKAFREKQKERKRAQAYERKKAKLRHKNLIAKNKRLGKGPGQVWTRWRTGRPRKPDDEVSAKTINGRKFTETDISNRTKDVGVMRSPEEIQELLKKLDCDPIARMTKIAERAEKAGDLNIAASLYKELAQYAAPKRKAQEPKVVKDKNLLTMSEDELMAEVTRLEESLA